MGPNIFCDWSPTKRFGGKARGRKDLFKQLLLNCFRVKGKSKQIHFTIVKKKKSNNFGRKGIDSKTNRRLTIERWHSPHWGSGTLFFIPISSFAWLYRATGNWDLSLVMCWHFFIFSNPTLISHWWGLFQVNKTHDHYQQSKSGFSWLKTIGIQMYTRDESVHFWGCLKHMPFITQQ